MISIDIVGLVLLINLCFLVINEMTMVLENLK